MFRPTKTLNNAVREKCSRPHAQRNIGFLMAESRAVRSATQPIGHLESRFFAGGQSTAVEAKRWKNIHENEIMRCFGAGIREFRTTKPPAQHCTTLVNWRMPIGRSKILGTRNASATRYLRQLMPIGVGRSARSQTPPRKPVARECSQSVFLQEQRGYAGSARP